MRTIKPRKTPDNLGNYLAREGLTRCFCGCKYWELDCCIDCGTKVEKVLAFVAENGGKC